MEYPAKVSRKGQVTIPVAIRRRLGITAPGKVAFVIEKNGRVVLRPVKLTAKDLAGIVPAIPGRETGDFEDMIREAMEDRADEIVRKMGGL